MEGKMTDILPSEVESVKTIGSLFDSEVKLVKTHGGFHVAIGKKKKNSRNVQTARIVTCKFRVRKEQNNP